MARLGSNVLDWLGAKGVRKLVSTIAIALLLEVGSAMALCQLAFFPITIPSLDIRFHSLLICLPFAASALYLSLPAYLVCAALLGGVLCARIQFLPLDFYDTLFSDPVGAVLISCAFALVIWLALNGTKRLLEGQHDARVDNAAYAAALFVASLVLMVGWVLYAYAVLDGEVYPETIGLLVGPMWSKQFWAQVVFNWATWLAATIFVGFLIRRLGSGGTEPPLRSVFRRWLLLVVLGAFLLTTSVSFLFSSAQSLGEAEDTLNSQIEQICSVVSERVSSQRSVEGLADNYDDGFVETVAIGKDGRTVSDNNAYYDDIFEDGELMAAASEGGIQFFQDSYSLDVTYYCCGSVDGYDVAAFAANDRVFENRTSVLMLNTMCYLVLFVAVFVLLSLLLDGVVVRGFRRTNHTLSLITDGDLGQRVDERGTQEFCELSAGINTTVEALRGYIDEAERRMERDLATAKAIQQGVLPRTFPAFPEIEEFDIYASMDAAKEVGGDFYDFFLIDERTLGFLIADVSGKGIPGALFMMTAKAEIENRMLEGAGLAAAMSGANQYLCANNDAGMFVTVWAATLDWETGVVTYVNAGHNYPLLRHGDDGDWEWLDERSGMFVGAFDELDYHEKSLRLAPGDKLVLYTDGVNEAFSANDEQYGNQRLEDFLGSHGSLSPRAITESLRADVASWAEGTEQSDDVTILVLEYQGASPKSA